MGRPKKYPELDIYAPQKAYLKSTKGKAALKKYRTSEKGKAKARDLARRRRGTIVDKQQWFIDTYGDVDTALDLLSEREQKVVELYYGLDTGESLNQTAIANQLGTSIATVSRTKKEALAKLEPLKQSVASSQN